MWGFFCFRWAKNARTIDTKLGESTASHVSLCSIGHSSLAVFVGTAAWCIVNIENSWILKIHSFPQSENESIKPFAENDCQNGKMENCKEIFAIESKGEN